MTSVTLARAAGHAHREPDGLVAACFLSFLATAGIFYVNIMPALVSGLISGLGFTQREAGFVGSANLYGAAFGALTIVLLVARIAWRRASIALLAALVLADALSMAVHAPWVMIPLRAVHGFLGGMLVGVAFSVIARTKSPDRVFGVLLFVQFGLGGLGVMTLPRLVAQFGTGVLFVALIAFSAVTLAMLPFLGSYPPRPAPGHTTGRGTRASTPRFVLALLAIFLFQASNMGLFAYIIELGSAAGLARDFISTSVGAATWVGVAGCLLVIALATRFGRALPLAIGLAATLVGIWVLHYAGDKLVFVLANCVTGANKTDYHLRGVNYGFSLNKNIITIDASAQTTGGTLVQAGNPSNASTLKFIGGGGNDAVGLGTVLATGASLDGGGGTDTIRTNNATFITGVTGAFIKNFEVVDIAANITVDLDHLSANNTLTGLRLGGASNVVNNVSATVGANVTVYASGSPNLNLKGATTGGQIDTVTIEANIRR